MFNILNTGKSIKQSPKNLSKQDTTNNSKLSMQIEKIIASHNATDVAT